MPILQAQKSLGAPLPGQCTGNPCNAANGNKYQLESDHRNTDSTPSFTRSYNSQLTKDIGLGFGWSSPFHKRLEVSGSVVQIRQADGRGEPFSCANNVCTGDADTKLVLTQDSSGYTLTHRDNSAKHYNLTGELLSETDGAGLITSYNYDTSGRLATVTNTFGHTFTFGYNANNHISTVTDSAGKVIGYTYDTNNNLTRVDYPDATAKLYHYNEPAFTSGANLPNHLTGISYVDGTGVVTRYATFSYDATGKAVLTQHAQTDNGSPQEKFGLTYDVPAANLTTVTDPVSMQEVMTFSTNLGVKNLTLKVNQSDSKSVQQTFDGNNNLTCRKDEENRVTLYSYNATNQKLSLTEGLSGTDCSACLANPANCNVGGVGRVTTYDYLSPTLDLPRFIRRPSVASGQTFETEIVSGNTGHPNLPTQIIQRGFTPSNASVSRTISLGYNTSGQVNSINGPRTDVSDITTLEYYECTIGGACGQLKKVINALGHITAYDLYDANGRLKQMTDPNGLKTSYTYDARGRVKTISQTLTSGPVALTQYSYTPWGDVSQVIDPDGVALNYGYDAAHYLRTITDGAGNQIRYKYDLKGNRTQDYMYDPYGYLTRSVAYTYDLRNHPNSSTLANNTTQLIYDAVGNLTQETDPNSQITAHTPDALNRLFRTVDALSGITGYGYDINDRPTTITAPNNATTQYQYDDLGNRLQEISPDRGKTTYTYDAAGNVLTVTDARKITTTYAYDALNRVVSKQSTDASAPSYSYVYDTCFKGRLCYFPGTLLFGYDSLGRLNYQLDLNTFLYSNYVFTSAGRLSHIDYPNRVAVDYTYDNAGRVSQISTTTTDGVTTVLAQSFHYYPFGPLNSFSFGNGQYYFENVDQAYRPTFQRNGPRWKNASYDPAGNLAGLNDFNGTAQTFGYDALNELTSAEDTQVGSYGSLAYDYLSNGVSNGNRQSETRNGSVNTYTYANNTNRLVYTDSLYLLSDAAGNTTWSSYTYVMGYDGYGRITSARSGAATYTYDPLDQRTKKIASGVTTRFAYGPQGELLYETGSGGKAYVYLNGMPLARIDGANIYYYHTDQLGAPQLMTNSAGATVWKANYEPFGSATVTVSSIANNLRYPGQYFDSETGLHYNMARYYDPKIGRYISNDPIGLTGGLNTYSYVYNNPLSFIDPLWD
ncbi:MAG: RHS repeat-associated core domain-containing protein [Sulfuricaulis sp.]|uniref:RHS repeat-associated core domain-containing protein n=1 Tax=Sulfuricaulis sp. TaxID=2003553 RepID=UPI003C6996B8